MGDETLHNFWVMGLLKQDRVVFHVGMPKSASTTIQQYFSKALPHGYFGHENNSELSQAFLQVVRGIEVDLEELSSRVNDAVGEGPLFFSSEFAVSYWTPLAGGYPQPVTVIADRLHALAPDATVVLVLRNPLKMMESLFAQLLLNEHYALDAGKLTYERWLDRNIQLFEKGWPSAMDLMNYPRILRAYDAFDAVRVYFLEEIARDFEGFVNGELAGLLGKEGLEKYESATLNTRHSKGEIKTKALMRKKLNAIKRRFPALVNAIPKGRREKFERSWERTAERMPGSLAAPKCRPDQQQWLEQHFARVLRALPQELKDSARDLGYPL